MKMNMADFSSITIKKDAPVSLQEIVLQDMPDILKFLHFFSDNVTP